MVLASILAAGLLCAVTADAGPRAQQVFHAQAQTQVHTQTQTAQRRLHGKFLHITGNATPPPSPPSIRTCSG